MNWKSLRESAWAIPLCLCVTTLTALILALVAEGFWDWLSWAMLAVPLVLVIRCVFRR